MVVLLISSGGQAVSNDGPWRWEPFGPPGNSDGLVAIEADAHDDNHFWVAGSSAVWVTGDGGDTFSVVFEAPRHRGSSRASHALDDDEDLIRDFDSFNPMDFDRADTLSEPWLGADDPDMWSETGPSSATQIGDAEDDEPDDDVELMEGANTEEVSEDRLNPFIRGRFGITRLRLIGADLWICTSRGLWRVARDARGLGKAKEVPLARRVGVNDVASVGPKLIVVATDAGLWLIGAGPSTRVRGIEYDTTVTAMALTRTHLFAATSRGLYRGDKAAGGFERLGGGRRSRAGITDVLATEDRVLATDGTQVFAYDGSGARLLSVSQVPGAQRLFRDGAARVWAVGEQGPWVEGPDGWTRLGDGLADRRLSDGTNGCGRSDCTRAPPRLVGAHGGWRGARDLEHQQIRDVVAGLERAIARRPSLAALIAKAEAQRALTLGDVQSFASRERLSWLVPSLEVRVRAGTQRDAQMPFIAALDRRILEAVTVTPVQAEFQVMAYWDLMPAVLASLDASQSRVYEASRISARQTQRRIRETLSPLWRRWASEQQALWRDEPTSPRAAVRAVLQVAHLEAELHALTAGGFPMTEDTATYFFHKD